MRYKPSKPLAVLGIVFGIGLLVLGFANFWDAGGGWRAFLVFWCLMVVGVTGVQTWAAFSKNGSMGVLVPSSVVSADDEESRPAR